jgi:anti-sigma factor (TIGR02949 family)
MAFCCADIETLVHAYLDGELATHDLEELEQHMALCGACKAKVDEELQFRAELRRKLVPPGAPDLLRARVGALLDAEDRAAQAAQRRRGAAWILPGAASVAAAAALVLVVAMPANDEVAEPKGPTPERPAPTRVPSIGDSARRYDLPDFSALGAKPRAASFDKNEVTYEVERNHARHLFQLAIIPDARGMQVPGERIELHDGVEAWAARINGLSAITIPGVDGSVWVLSSSSMSPDQLVDLIEQSANSWLRHAPDPSAP